MQRHKHSCHHSRNRKHNGGLMMRKGGRLRTFAYFDLLGELGSYRFCLCRGEGVGDASNLPRHHSPFLSHWRLTSRVFEISKVQSQVGPHSVTASLPNLKAVGQCRRLSLCLFPKSLLSTWSSYSLGPSVLVIHKGPTFVNEGAR